MKNPHVSFYHSGRLREARVAQKRPRGQSLRPVSMPRISALSCYRFRVGTAGFG